MLTNPNDYKDKKVPVFVCIPGQSKPHKVFIKGVQPLPETKPKSPFDEKPKEEPKYSVTIEKIDGQQNQVQNEFLFPTFEEASKAQKEYEEQKKELESKEEERNKGQKLLSIVLPFFLIISALWTSVVINLQ